MAPDGTVAFESILQPLKDRVDEIPAAITALLQAAHNLSDRVNMLGLFELHIGEQTCAEAPKECWDLKTSRSVILATAKAAMLAAADAAKSARLPSAVAAVTLLESDEAQTFLASLQAAVAASVDDLPRALGTQAAEGTKQTLQCIVTSFESGMQESGDSPT